MSTGVDRLTEPLAVPLAGRTGQALGKQLGLVTVGDLLRHYPRRYLDRAELTDLGSLEIGDDVTVLAEVLTTSVREMKTRRGKLMEVVVTDGRGTLELTFFNPKGHKHRLTPGTRALFSGTVTLYAKRRQLTQPAYEPLPDDVELDETAARELAGRPIPVYPATATVPSWKVANSLRTVLDTIHELPDPIPAEIRARHGLLGLLEAFQKLHRPNTPGDYREARRRLRFEEAFVLQVALARRRAEEQGLPASPRTAREGGLRAAFEARLPFELTAGQRAVGEQIAADLARGHPMHRLLQGEVGSGKTLVALRAMLTVIDAGGQAALLAPTEVLAAQHHRSITAMLGDLAAAGMLGGHADGTRVALLTGSLPAAARRRALLEAAGGEAGIVVGTHALLNEKVAFVDLGLVVVDEQHRFGVQQRDALREKGKVSPHLLVMTATPIPRTVAMTVFGDLEVCTLSELPPGRSPIASHVVPVGEKPQWLRRVWQRVAEEVRAGHQAYVVCPRIGGDDADALLESQGGDDADDPAQPQPPEQEGARRPGPAVLDVCDLLRSTADLDGVLIEALHGRMPAEERDGVMARFAAGRTHVLVATTVVEVGVDVPNATVMVVLDADRFGVSQLHQLRGRVGRGAAAGLCLLVTDLEPEAPGRQRVQAVADTLDGFELARVDLEQRREGDVLGAAQSGVRSSLRLLRVLRDEKVIEAARHEATALVAADPQLSSHPALMRALEQLLDPEREAYLDRG